MFAPSTAHAAPTVVVTHPTRWTAYTAEVLGEALDRAGLTDVTLVPESVATMRWLEVTRGPQSDGLAVVYDLGATALDVTLMRTGSEAGPHRIINRYGASQFVDGQAACSSSVAPVSQ